MTMRVWQLLSETGTPTECCLEPQDEGAHELTILHNGSVAAREVYASELQARSRAMELNRALLARGWSDAPESGAGT